MRIAAARLAITDALGRCLADWLEVDWDQRMVSLTAPASNASAPFVEPHPKVVTQRPNIEHPHADAPFASIAVKHFVKHPYQ